MVEHVEPAVRKSGISEHLKDAAAYGIILAVGMGGVALSSLVWSTANSQLQDDLRRANADSAAVRVQLGELKTEYALYRDGHPAKDAGSGQAQPGSRPGEPIKEKGQLLASKEKTTGAPPPELHTREILSVVHGTTGDAFNGELTISVAGIQFLTDPTRYRVTVTVSAPGLPQAKMEHAGVGDVVRYKTATGVYEVTVRELNSYSASFSVVRLQGSS